MQKKLSFQVFNTNDDYLKWHKLIEFVAQHEDFSSEEKLAIEQAFRELSRLLGKSFLIEGAKFKHFLSQHFMNKAPWALRWAIWFADALKHLVKNDEAGKILSKLKSKLYHEEALTFLEINYYLSKAGFEIQFEQEVIVDSISKFPDFRLKNPANNDVIFLELTTLHISDEHDWNKSKFHQMSAWISKGLLQYQINYCGKISNLTDSNFDKISYEILLMKKEIIANKGFYCIEDENLTFAMAHPDNSEDLVAWAKARDFNINSLTGDEIKLDGDFVRLKNKIKDKISQLSDKSLNIIGISMHQLFMMAEIN